MGAMACQKNANVMRTLCIMAPGVRNVVADNQYKKTFIAQTLHFPFTKLYILHSVNDKEPQKWKVKNWKPKDSNSKVQRHEVLQELLHVGKIADIIRMQCTTTLVVQDVHAKNWYK
jgi:hypothetical protein